MSKTDPEKIEEWEASLLEPLEWQSTESEAVVELESNSFMAMMAKGGG